VALSIIAVTEIRKAFLRQTVGPVRLRRSPRRRPSPYPTGVAVLQCCTGQQNGRSHDRNRPVSWVGDTGIEPVTSSV
jgi:hypothetical protein